MKSIASLLVLFALAGCQSAPAVKPVYGPTNPTSEQRAEMKVKRFGSVIGLRPEKEQYYRDLHAATWEGVVKRVKESNIRNYSIYVTELNGKKYLFSYMEYDGDDFEADMEAIAEDPITQKWWKETDPCQIRLPNRQKPEDNWSAMETVFFLE